MTARSPTEFTEAELLLLRTIMAIPEESKQHLRNVLGPLHSNNAGVTVAEHHTTVTAVAGTDTHASVTPDVRAPSPAPDAPNPPDDGGGANAAGDKRKHEDDGVGGAPHQPPKKREKRDIIQTYEKMLVIDDYINRVMSRSELAASYKVNEGYIVDIIGNQKAIFAKFYEEVLVMRLHKTGSTDYEIMQKTWTHVGKKGNDNQKKIGAATLGKMLDQDFMQKLCDTTAMLYTARHLNDVGQAVLAGARV
jgi:predicted DNA-binding protein YlxM (UPF0122 family)